jgi:LmbE family N-acetylglucosaminyl deacetylase
MTDADRLAAEAALMSDLHAALLPLRSVASFMQTGAHPDDETSSLLALLHHRHGLRISYACSTRGEGGQNVLGAARGADLAALRTREQERAAGQLGMVLYWLTPGGDDPAVDFRFSKSGEETLARWGHARVLERLVRALRTERPDCVCPTFLDVPGQHGHHRAMTRLAREAFELAGDPSAFPQHAEDGLRPWSAQKFYLPAWSGAGDSYDDAEAPPKPTLAFDVGEADPALGVPYARIGEWSRRFHRTQGMGRWVEAGPMPRPLHLAASRLGPAGAEEAITDGLPATLADLDGGPDLSAAQVAIAQALAVPEGDATLPGCLADALSRLRRALATLRADHPQRHRVYRKEAEVSRALLLAAGVRAKLAAPDAVVMGAPALLETSIAGPGRILGIRLPPGFGMDADGRLAVEDAAAARAVSLVFDPAAPQDRPLLRVEASIAGVTAEATFAASHPVAAMPALALLPEGDGILVNRLAPPLAPVLRLRAEAAPGWAGVIGLSEVPGLNAAPRPLALPSGGPETVELPLICQPGLLPDRATAELLVDGAPVPRSWREAHAHLGLVHRLSPARLTVAAVDCAIAPGTRIAYVGAGSDRVDHWLRSAGMAVEAIAPGALERTDLSGFSTVLIGIFGFGLRAELRAARAALHGFVRAGGHLVTLYHRPSDGWDPGATPLARLEIGRPSLRWRVTDAAAPVTHLLPDHPLLRSPNRIGPADWAGWARERGLYFASAWDGAYEALVELADPGEAPLRGGLLTGAFGSGRHTHIALALHTELDALTPGAVRIMANLVQPAPMDLA